MLKGLLHASSKQVVYLFEILAVLLAIVVAAAYFVSTEISGRQEEVSGWLTDYIGYPVEVSDIDITWAGIVPKVRVQGVTVHPTETDEVKIEEAELGFDLYESAKRRTAIFSKVGVIGVRLSVMRSTDDIFSVIGKEWRAGGSGTSPDLAWVAALQKVSLQNISLDYQDQVQPYLSGDYVLKSGMLKQVGSGWVWQTELTLPVALGDEVGFHGNFNKNNSPNATWEFVANNINAVLLQDRMLKGMVLTQGKADIRLTGTAKGWQPNQAKGNITLSDVGLASAIKQKVQPVSIDMISSQLAWQREAAGNWSLISDIQIGDATDPRSRWQFERTLEGMQVVSADKFQLKELTEIVLLSDSLLADTVQQQLSKQKPAGDIHDLAIQYHPTQGLKNLEINMVNVSILPWQEMPGVNGLTAQLSTTGDSGQLQLTSQQLTITPTASIKPIKIDSLLGDVQWEKSDSGMRWYSDHLQVKNADFELDAMGTITQNEDNITNDIEVNMQNINVAKWQDYVDVTKLAPEFYTWAKGAFVAGKVRSGKLIWQGALADFPYDKSKQKGVFDISLSAEKVHLHYAPEWPDLIGLTGKVKIKNNTLTVDSKQGEIAGFAISSVNAKITNLMNRRAVLTVDGTMQGKTAHAFEFLQNSPLKSKFGAYISGVASSGGTAIDLGLEIPLADAENTQVTGTAKFNQSTLLRADLFDVPITNIEGDLAFTNFGLTAHGLTGLLLDMPVNVDVATRSVAGKTITTVDAQGRLTAAKVAEVLGQSMPTFIAGEADYTVQVAIEERASGEFEISSTISSDLAGIAVDMPIPLGKASAEKKDFQTQITWLESGAQKYVGLYGDVATLAAQREQGNWRGELRLGKNKSVVPENGWRVRGKWAELALTPWQAWLDKQPDSNNAAGLTIDDVAVQFDALSLGGHTLHDLSLSTHKGAKVWVIQLSSDEVAGKVHWPLASNTNEPLEANLKYLHLQLPESNNTETITPRKPDLWPSIKLYCEKFTLDGVELGVIDLISHRETSAWILDSATLKGAAYDVMVSGKWEQTETGEETTLFSNGESDNGEALLTHFGFQPAVRTDAVDVSLDLRWPGSPALFSRENMTGKMSINIAKGQLLEVEPGAAGRVFGLLSFTALPRRLSLDFSDLFGKGFSFDAIKGRFNIADGNAVTDNSRMRGPTADIEVTGRVGLVAKDYDQQITVTPNLSSSLPLAGAAAGGAVGLGVGAAVLLADKAVNKLFGGNIINLISYQYKLTGTWDKPEFSEQEVNEEEVRTREIQHTIGNQ